jgi:hypothetical protein
MGIKRETKGPDNKHRQAEKGAHHIIGNSQISSCRTDGFVFLSTRCAKLSSSG